MFVCAFHGVSPQVVRLAEMASEREPWMACQFREREWSSFVRPKRSSVLQGEMVVKRKNPTLLTTALLLAIHSCAADAPSPGVRYRAAVVEIYPAPYSSWDGTAAGAVALMMMNVKTADDAKLTIENGGARLAQ